MNRVVERHTLQLLAVGVLAFVLGVVCHSIFGSPHTFLQGQRDRWNNPSNASNVLPPSPPKDDPPTMEELRANFRPLTEEELDIKYRRSLAEAQRIFGPSTDFPTREEFYETERRRERHALDNLK